MKVTVEVGLEGKTQLDCTAEVNTFADMSKLAGKIVATVKGVKKLLPDLASKSVDKVRIVTE
jgi:hypothetical protein